MRTIGSSRATPIKRRILIVDDHALVRLGLTQLINGEPDLEVCAEAATQQAGLAAIVSEQPDLIVADLSLGDDDGLELIKQIRSFHRDLPVLVLSMHDTPMYAERSFRAGANGYVTKPEMSEEVLIGIRRVLEGRQYVSPRIRSQLEPSSAG